MNVHDEIIKIVQDHELLCRTLAEQIPGAAEQGSLKEKLLKMADNAADVGAGIFTEGGAVIATRALERALL